MRLREKAILTITMVGVACSLAIAAQANLDDLLKQVAAYDYGKSRAALTATEDLIKASHKDAAQRKQIVAKLIAFLDSKATVAAKRFVCRQLSIIAGPEAVPVRSFQLLFSALSLFVIDPFYCFVDVFQDLEEGDHVHRRALERHGLARGTDVANLRKPPVGLPEFLEVEFHAEGPPGLPAKQMEHVAVGAADVQQRLHALRHPTVEEPGLPAQGLIVGFDVAHLSGNGIWNAAGRVYGGAGAGATTARFHIGMLRGVARGQPFRLT